MKRVVIALILCLGLFSLVSAYPCNLEVSMINQDPYPAIPGEYVKVVFQIDGIENPDCGDISFRVKEAFPVSLDPDVTNPIKIKAGTYQRDYSSFYIAAYKVRLSEDALEGDNPIEVAYSTKSSAEILKEFQIHVEDARADFEIYIKDYDYTTQVLTFEILNIADVDVEALTIEIPKQEGIQIKGPNRVVVGDLDSNEYTTAEFEATDLQEGDIKLDIIYTDTINVRRDLEKTVSFDASYFTGRGQDQGRSYTWLYVVIVLILGYIGWRYYKKRKHKKKMMRR